MQVLDVMVSNKKDIIALQQMSLFKEDLMYKNLIRNAIMIRDTFPETSQVSKQKKNIRRNR